MTPETYSSSGAGTWIFLGIFFSIIIILVVVATVGSKKDKTEKLIENDKKKKLRNSATSGRVIIFSALDITIRNLNKELEDFKPSIGLKSLGEINKEYFERIKLISASEEVKSIYVSEDYKAEMKPIINGLLKVKPSNWNKDAMFSVNLIDVKIAALKKSKINSEWVKTGEKMKWKTK